MDATLIGFSNPQKFDDVDALPKFRLEDGTEIEFQGHHVISQKQFGDASDFFSALDEAGLWNPKSFMQNGIALPTSDALGVAVHSGYHPAYSGFIGKITTSFRDKYERDDFGGKTEPEGSVRSAMRYFDAIAVCFEFRSECTAIPSQMLLYTDGI